MRKFISMCAIVFMANLVLSAFTSCSSDDDSPATYTTQQIAGTWETIQIDGVVVGDNGEPITLPGVKFDKVTEGDWRAEYYTRFKFVETGTAFEYHPNFDDGSLTWEVHEDAKLEYTIDGNKLTLFYYYEGKLDVVTYGVIEELTNDKLVLYFYDEESADGTIITGDTYWMRLTLKRV